MNYEALKREIEHLEVLLSIKADRDEDEDALILLLLGFLAQFQEDEDDNMFKSSVLGALSDAYKKAGDYPALVTQELSFQSGYLTKFIQDMNNGRVSDAMARFRARLYANSLGKIKERMWVEEQDEEDRGKWIINPSLENCDDCRMLSDTVHTMRWYKKNHVPKDGNTACGQNCGCKIKPV